MSEVDKTVESTTSKPKMPVQKPLMEMGTAIQYETHQYPVTLDGKQESE
jgi:5-enolpyruvylshikimate-3-phosphate synthase